LSYKLSSSITSHPWTTTCSNFQGSHHWKPLEMARPELSGSSAHSCGCLSGTKDESPHVCTHIPQHACVLIDKSPSLFFFNFQNPICLLIQ
jgi:hypothetical protein